MIRRVLASFALVFAASTLCVVAETKLPPQPQGAETQFVSQIQKDLMARYPTAADAEKAGYFRYTNEDSTGSISYANLQWTSNDPQHPSQLWYDVNGKLLGADFSQPYVEGSPPNLWGVNPGRWVRFRQHVHYVADVNGTAKYGGFGASKFTAAGGSLQDPNAATVVKLGGVTDPSQVKKVFVFPAIWDLIVWVKPNPAGAFNETNPNVKPSANAEKDSM